MKNTPWITQQESTPLQGGVEVNESATLVAVGDGHASLRAGLSCFASSQTRHPFVSPLRASIPHASSDQTIHW
jgi:hypothetical protein